MSAISLKSITGITSITTPAGVDNQLTLHNNNTTEAVKLDVAGNLHFHNHLNITGVSTASNFKTGTSNLHNTGLNVQDLDVDGHTNLDNVSVAGVTTITSAAPELHFTDTNANSDYSIVVNTGQFRIRDETNSANRFAVNSDGHVDIVGRLDAIGGFHASANSLIEGHLELSRTGASQLIIKDSDTSGANSQQRISFRDSADTEMFFVGNDTTNSWLYLGSPSGQNNNIAFRVNGNDKFQVNGSGAYVNGALTVAGNADIADSIIHTGDTDTKIVFTDNQIDLQTGGASRVYAGNYGIFIQSGLGLGFLASSGPSPSIKSGGTNNQDLLLTTGAGNPTRLQIDSSGNIRQTKTGANVSLTLSRNESVGSTDQALGVIDFASNTAHTVQARLMAKSLGTSNVGGDLVVETRADGGSLDERLRISGSGDITAVNTASGGQSVTLKIGASNASGMNDGVIRIVNGGTGNGVIQWDYEGNANRAQIYVYRSTQDLIFTTAGSEKLRITSGGVVQIGGAVGNNADIDTSNTKLTIKQSANNREDGIYLERSGERRGWLMFVGGAYGYNDAFCLSTNQMGTKTDVLSIDRGNVLAKIGGSVIIDSTNNGYGGLRIYDDSSGDYNVRYIAGRNQGLTAHVFERSGRTQNQSPWANATSSEIARLTHTNGLSFQGDTNTFIGKYTQDSQGDHLRVVTNGKDRLHISKRGSIVAPKLGTKVIQWSSCNNKWASSRSITQFMIEYYTGASSATYHFMRMISQTDWGFEDVEVKQTRYQYSPDSGDHATFRYYAYYGSHVQETINYNQRGGTSSGNASNWIGTQYFGPGGAHRIHEAANGGYYRDTYGTDFYVSLGNYIGVRLEVKIYNNSGLYDTGIYATASDFYPAAFGANATQSAANSWGGPRGIWINTTSNGTGTGTAPVISTSNADTGWSSGVNYLDVSA